MAVDLKECINIIERGEWFAIRFITADVKKGSGGKVIELAKARIARKMHPLGSLAPSPLVEKAGDEGVRPPNHSLNFTRNLELPNKHIRKVHPILITHINHVPVV